jgi:predicted nucleotidyltransferase
MVIDSQTLNHELKAYLSGVKREMPIDKVYLFDSYAKGTARWDSDVDLCFFFAHFAVKNDIAVSVKLMEMAWKFAPALCVEPHVFPTSELDNDNPFVKEVLRAGREIKF